ncbi:mammalian cell entry protein [Mycolicibacterium confluentis]|nr:mammalian cell entry protein [Mycolicibacterium confluentis]
MASTDSGTVAAEPEASGEQGDAGGPADPEASGERGDAGRPADPGASSDLEEAAPTVDSDTESPDLAPTAVRRPGRVAVVALVAAAVLFVGFAAFAGAALQPVLADRAATATKLEIARTASGAITTLWTYTPENMDQLGDRAAGYLGGDFATEYRKYIDAIVPTNKQAQVSNSTEVVGAAVESLSATEATAIVYTNSTSTSPLSKNIPSLRYLSWRLTLHRDGTRWLVTGMAPVTSLDLTPQI